MGLRLKQPSALPGFGIALGYTLFYLGVVVLLPLAARSAPAASSVPAPAVNDEP